MSEIAFFAIPVVICLITGIFGGLAVHGRAPKPYVIALLLALGVSGGLAVGIQYSPGWDGIPYVIGLIMGALPAITGLLIGGIVGLVTRPRLSLAS